jgi:hypothetical protein
MRTRWRDLTPVQIFTLSARVAEAGEGVGFSLNLRDDIERSACKASDPVTFLAKRFSSALRAAGLAGRPLSFLMERTPEGRVHLHGVLILGDIDPARARAALC